MYLFMDNNFSTLYTYARARVCARMIFFLGRLTREPIKKRHLREKNFFREFISIKNTDYYAFDPPPLEGKGRAWSVINYNIADKNACFFYMYNSYRYHNT